MSRAVIALFVLLLASLGANAYQWQASRAPSSQSFDDLMAEMELRYESERENLVASQEAEKKELLDELGEEKRLKAQALADAKEARSRVRKDTIERAKASDAALGSSIAQAAGIPPESIAVSGDFATITRPAALEWLDVTLQMRDTITEFPAVIALRIAEERERILPGLMDEKHELQTENLELKQDLQTSRARETYVQGLLREQKSDTILWAVVGGVAGVVVGGAVGVGVMIGR